MAIASRPRRLGEGATEQGVSGFLLTPSAQAALFGLNMLQTNLEIWRRVTDSMRESMRAQQDAMLRMVLERSTDASVREAGEDAAEAAETTTETALNGATSFLTPVFAARRAYVQMSGAMIEAQREALQAFVNPRPH